MKKMIFLLIACIPLTAKAQSSLQDAIFNNNIQDSLLNYFIQNRDEYKKWHLDLSWVNTSTIIINVNVLNISDENCFDLTEKNFFKNLDFDKFMPSGSLIDNVLIDTQGRSPIYCFNVWSKENTLMGLGKCGLYEAFRNEIRVFGSKYDLSETKIFKLGTMPIELYFLNNNKIFVVDNGEIIDAIPYLKKKYKNKKSFLKAYNVEVH